MNFKTSRRHRWLTTAIVFVGIVLMGVGLPLAAQAPQQPQATGKPFLWRIEGPVPSYLYGTIHVPDRRVLQLPEVVVRAVDAADVLFTELPLDTATQLSIAPKLLLPEGQDLRKVAGEQLYGRLVRALTAGFGQNLPPGVGEMVAMTMSRMKPIMALTQLLQLEYLPDVLAGRKPLDATLYDMAVSRGKQVGGLETVDEQMAVMDSLSIEDQLKVLATTLDSLEKATPQELNSVRDLVDLYLSGDLDALAAEMNRQDPEYEILEEKFKTRLLDDRNVNMADRIAAHLSENPTKSYFFAVGAGHYPGDAGVLSLLGRKGLRVTRLGPSDAATLVKPAALRP